MPIVNFDLTPVWNSFSTDKVASGEFKDASEVVQAALQILERDVVDYEAKWVCPGRLDTLKTSSPRANCSRTSGCRSSVALSSPRASPSGTRKPCDLLSRAELRH